MTLKSDPVSNTTANGSYLGGNGKNTGLHMSTDRSDELSDWFRTFSTRYSRQVGTSLNSMMTAVYSENTKGRICLCSIALGRKVERFFDRSADCYTKCVPKKILVANNACIAAFLKGYFSGDGCLYVNHLKGRYDYYAISCSSVSRKLLDGISVLLVRLGIQHTIDRNGRINPGGYHSITRLHTLNINHDHLLTGLWNRSDLFRKKCLHREL